MNTLIPLRISFSIKVVSSILIIGWLFQCGCTTFKYSEGGRVESKYRNYYFNDSLRVGAVVYGDMDLEFNKNQKGTLAVKMTPFCKNVLQRFGLQGSQPLLFTSMSKKYSIIGLLRHANSLKLNEYSNVLDQKAFYLMKTIVHNGVEATEGLIRLDSNRFLSIIDYGESEREHAKDGFHTIMVNTIRRIRSGQSMMPVLNPFDDAEELFEGHGYLAPYILAASQSMYKEKSLFNQALATYYSFSGNQDSVRKLEKSFIGFNNKPFAAKDLLPAIDEILNQTLHKQVVMLNTAHHRPEHAYFVGQLLDRLREQGFTHLAVEALVDSSMVMERGFAILQDGFYLRDPVMANMINHAIALGFHVVSYDSGLENREQEQAKNLVDKTFKLKKDCKLVVLAGYAHIDEKAKPKRMAAFFHEMTGIDPLTIDQTRLMTGICEDMRVDNLEDVFLYPNKDSTIGTDLLVWNNLSLQNKPIGFKMSQIPVQTNIALPNSVSVTDSLITISVFNKVDYRKNINASPIHVTVLPLNSRHNIIKLYPGKYLLQYSDKNKELIYSKDLVIHD